MKIWFLEFGSLKDIINARKIALDKALSIYGVDMTTVPAIKQDAYIENNILRTARKFENYLRKG